MTKCFLMERKRERERFFSNILKIKFSLRIRFPICYIYKYMLKYEEKFLSVKLSNEFSSFMKIYS